MSYNYREQVLHQKSITHHSKYMNKRIAILAIAAISLPATGIFGYTPSYTPKDTTEQLIKECTNPSKNEYVVRAYYPGRDLSLLTTLPKNFELCEQYEFNNLANKRIQRVVKNLDTANKVAKSLDGGGMVSYVIEP